MFSASSLDIGQIRSFFPALNQQAYNKPLVYFDNAATVHKPLSVIDSSRHFYQQDNANIHRGVHALATRSTTALEEVRLAVQKFIDAPQVENIIFTSGATEGINLIAATYGRMVVGEGDEIIISVMEHHANLIPWQLLCKQQKAVLRVIPVDDKGQLDLVDFPFTKRTKIIALSYVSNTLGTINPIKTIIDQAHAKGAIVVIDGAQAVAHLPISVTDLDCDFFVFSAHKMYGLSGLGILYGKKKWLEAMPPYQTGGGMVQQVSLKELIYQDPPYKFEAGTLPLASIISFGEALKFILGIGYTNMSIHEEGLLAYALAGLAQIPEVKLVGTATNRVGIISFNLAHMHHLDVGLLLDAKGIAVRTGHCCTQPLMNTLGIEGVVRISFAVYNTIQEINLFLETLQEIIDKRKR